MTNNLQHFIKILLVTCLFAIPATAQEKPKLPENDRIRIAEAFHIGEQLGNEATKPGPAGTKPSLPCCW
ncbi:MAG: hypothetical protein HY276_06570 [Ignavibacteriales bacterium]|nr:hypothetical protein [Ignavibacteriales bacterium]